jgi:hypothetical protein
MKAVGDLGGLSEPVPHAISVRDTIEADGRNARMRGEPGRDRVGRAHQQHIPRRDDARKSATIVRE